MSADWLIVLSLACLLTALLGAFGVWWLEARADRQEARSDLFDWAADQARNDWNDS